MTELWLCEKCDQLSSWVEWRYEEEMVTLPNGDPDESLSWECPKCQWRIYVQPTEEQILG